MPPRPPMNSTPVRATMMVGVLFVSGLLAGAMAGAAAASRANDPYEGLDLFARVLTTIERDYVQEIDSDTLVEAAIRGMVDELDEHSRWMTPEEFRLFLDETQGSYEGIGIEVRRVSRGVLVAHVLPGGPAERDGLLSGDIIVGVDGTPVAGLPLEKVTSLIKGPRGAPVDLSIAREGWEEPRVVRTVRDRVATPAVAAERLDSGVGYVRLYQFQEDASESLLETIRELSATAPLTGLVLDLRDNPGGLLDEAVEVSDLFLDEGIIVSTKGRADGAEAHIATPGGVKPELPVVVLVNGMSASAAEIVAGALQDTQRASLVGTHTYGKGSVQVLYENRDQSALRLTTSRYYTPSGAPVAAEQGRVPEHLVELPQPPDPAAALRERIASLEVPPGEKEVLLQLVEALAAAEEPHEPLVPWDGTVAERRQLDPQLDFALRLLEDGS
ncbi:MAG: S41 family peptidase [Deltaproteobacteria bacterium]|nr:S41 family peptidase [Deltaproteobacteria bacterium]MBW2252972.1 S41 family peptidase [Deltaproteobacteria bacterium]